MNDPPGSPSPLGIEVVEWIAEGGDNLTVRVTGRWRRRRPAWSGQPTLVIEAPGRRYRFPAMPEPPSLSGAAPGMWRISFAVPAALAPDLGGRAWLQFGAVVVPLPAAVEAVTAADLENELRPIEQPAAPEPAQPGPASPHPHPSAELEFESARRRAAEAEAEAAALRERLRELEGQLGGARAEAEQLSASLAGQQATRRGAEQRAHAERAQRLELERTLAQRTRDAERTRQALGDLATAEERIRGLEAELGRARRRIDEAEQAAAAAAAARERAQEAATEALQRAEHARSEAERALAEPAGERSRLELERGLIDARARVIERVASEPQAPVVAAPPAGEPGTPPLAAEPVQLVQPPDTTPLFAALRLELDQRARAEAALRARLIDAEAALAAREALQRRTAETLRELREELDGLRDAIGHEREGRETALRRAADLQGELELQQERTSQASAAIDELREMLEAIREAQAAAAAAVPEPEPAPEPEPPPAATAPPQTAPGLESARLADALSRLRESVAPLDEVANRRSVAEPAQGSEPAPDPEPAPEPDLKPELESEPGPQPTDEAYGRAPRVTRAWLRPGFRALAQSDPELAGRLLIALLPAQGQVHPEPVSYDLVLGGEDGCVQVTAESGASRVITEDHPRERREVDFQVLGGPASIARLLIAGALARRFGRGVAKLRGQRRGIGVLEDLVGMRLSLEALQETGVILEPRVALGLLSVLIDPDWTKDSSFTLSYAVQGSETAYLEVTDGGRPRLFRPLLAEPITTAISGSPGALERLLVSVGPPEEADLRPERGELGAPRTTLTGEQRPLTQLRKWVKLAQSG